MPPSESDGRAALRDHVLAKAQEARARYGPAIDAATIVRMLDDGAVVRYPTGLRYDAEPLQPGEFAFPMPLGEHPANGFCLFVHPAIERRPELLPLVVAYHIPSINYGDIVAAEDAELFGATLLGLDVEAYYDALCTLADELAPPGGPAGT